MLIIDNSIYSNLKEIHNKNEQLIELDNPKILIKNTRTDTILNMLCAYKIISRNYEEAYAYISCNDKIMD